MMSLSSFMPLEIVVEHVKITKKNQARMIDSAARKFMHIYLYIYGQALHHRLHINRIILIRMLK